MALDESIDRASASVEGGNESQTFRQSRTRSTSAMTETGGRPSRRASRASEMAISVPNPKRRSRVSEHIEEAAAREVAMAVPDPLASPCRQEAKELVEKEEAKWRRKAKELHDEWEEKVYKPIAQQISTAVSRVHSTEGTRRIQNKHKEYLETLNRKTRSIGPKAGLFNDSIVPSEYNPFADSMRLPTAYIPKGSDPLKRSLRQERPAWEGGSSEEGPAKLKDTLSPAMWSAVESTPHGWMTDREGNLREAKRETKLQRSKAAESMDHFTFPRDSPRPDRPTTTTSLQGPPGDGMSKLTQSKRRVPPPGEGRKQGTGMFGVVNCLDPPDDPGGKEDKWLSRRGKARVQPPFEAKTRRRGLGDVISHTASRERGMGDSWLDMRGKRKLPGPSEENPTMRELLSWEPSSHGSG